MVWNIQMASLESGLESSLIFTPISYHSYTAEFENKFQEEKDRYIDLVEKSIKDIIKDEVKSQLPQILPKEVSDFATLMIQSAINESVENVILDNSFSQPKSTYETAASLTEFELKKILLDKIHKSKSYQDAPEHKELYDALVKSYNLGKDLFSSYGKAYSLKRDHEDEDKDGYPLARSNQRFKKRKTKELVFEAADTEMQQDLRSEFGYTDDQPDDAPKYDRQPLLTFDELVSTPIHFSAYVINHLKIDNLTQEILVGLAFNLLKEGHEYPFDLSKPLPFIEDQGRQVFYGDYFINNDLEYLKGGSSSRKYTTSTTKTKAAKYDNFEGIKDMVSML
nr:hypothetical protein [Tanacetum cinerariifolium]